MEIIMQVKDKLDDYVQNWISRKVAHPKNLKVGFHFHNVEEWLVVLSGSGTFYPLNESEIAIKKDTILHIPQGEIHRVDVGPDGLLYNMWIPKDISPNSFSHPLGNDEVQLLSAHLNLPHYENERDADWNNRVPEGYSEVLLADLMSEGLSFRNAEGELSDKKTYLTRDAGKRREIGGEGGLCVLHRCAECIVISSVVDTPSTTGSFFNLRLLAAENDGWKCTTWMNFNISTPIQGA
jgi:hypothetical protein